jgi:nucleotide-binding universal stress UspA family protein
LEQEGREMGEPTTRQRRVLVGVDGSKGSMAALDWAAQEASLRKAALTVVTSWDWPRSFGWAVPVVDGYDPAADAGELVERIVKPVRDAFPDLDIQTAVVEGHAGFALTRLSAGADLLVVGSRGHGELMGVLLGSVSEYCVTHADCPVVVYRPDNVPSELSER